MVVGMSEAIGAARVISAALETIKAKQTAAAEPPGSNATTTGGDPAAAPVYLSNERAQVCTCALSSPDKSPGGIIVRYRQSSVGHGVSQSAYWAGTLHIRLIEAVEKVQLLLRN
jgi:hypothetical protein